VNEFHDVLVVGSGPIGITVARRLAERGLQVMVLEAGSAITDPPGSHLRNQPAIQHDPDGYLAAIEPYMQPVSGDLPGAADSSLVGGQGILWTNNCPRACEFERWECMTPAEWEQRYAEAEDYLQVVADAAAASKTGQRLRECLRSVLVKEGRATAGLPFSGRMLPDGPIHYNGPSDILAAATPEVRARITIRACVRATRLVHQANRVTGLEVEGIGPVGRLDAPTVILAGGAIATPRLLYRSGIRPKVLGRGISFHALLLGQVILEAHLCPSADEMDFAPRLYIPPTVDTPWHVMVLRDTCPLPATERVANSHRLVEFQAFLPVEFRDENLFEISDAGHDEFRFAFSPRDQDLMQAMRADVERLASCLGQWRQGCEANWIPHGLSHLVGTCRMDRPGWKGVANKVGKVHGLENLYLASVGLIPAPMAENPTLTAVALALKTCDHIAPDVRA